MKRFYFMLLTIIGCASSTEPDLNPNPSELVLEALRERPGVSFSNKTRNYYTPINDPSLFETIFPGTEKTCGYILRFYFYTNIHLAANANELFSMDGSKFYLSQSDDNVVNLTREVIQIIGRMSMGSSELEKFLEDYPNARL